MASSGKNGSLYFTAKSNVTQVLQNIQANLKNVNNALNTVGQNTKPKQLAAQARNLASTLKSTESAAKGAGTAISGMSAGIGKLAAITAGVISLRAAFQSAQEFFKHGLEVEANFQGAKNGIAGILMSVYDIKDAQGGVLSEQEKFNVALSISSDQARKLRKDAMEGAASYAEMLDTFQQGLGPGGTSGLTPDQVRQMAVVVANAAKSMNMLEGMAGQEMRAIVGGKIDKTATIGSALGFKDDQKYKDLQKKGGQEFFDYVQMRMRGFVLAAQETASTLAGTFATIQLQYDKIAQDSVGRLTERLQKLGPLFGQAFSDTGEISEGFQPLVDLLDWIGGEAGETIVNVMTSIVESAKNLGEYFKQNPQDLLAMTDTLGTVGSMISQIFDTVVSIGSKLLDLILDWSGLSQQIKDSGGGLTKFGAVLKLITAGAEGIRLIFFAIKQVIGGIIDIVRALAAQIIDLLLDPMREFLELIQKGLRAVGQDEWANSFQEKIDSFKNTRVKILTEIAGEDNPFAPTGKEINRDGGILEQVYSDKNIADKANMAVEAGFAKFGEEFDKAVTNFENTGTKGGENAFKIAQDNFKRNADKFFKNLKAEEEKAAASSAQLTSRDRDGKEKNKKPEDLLKLAYQKQLDVLKKAAQDEQGIYEDKNKYLDLNFSQSLISIQDYYQDRNKLYQDNYKTQIDYINKEIEAVNAQNPNAKSEKDRNALAKELNDLINKRAELERNYAFENKKNMADQQKALLDYSNGLREMMAQIYALQGNDKEANRISFELKFEGLEKMYQADKTALSMVAKLKELTARQNEFNQSVADFNKISEKQSTEEERISILKENGYITELDSLVKIRDIRLKYLDSYQKQIDLLDQIKEKSPEQIQQLEQLRNKMLQLKLTVDPLKDKFDQLFETSLSSALTDFMDKTKTASEAFKDFAKSIERSLLELANQEVVKMFASWLFNTGSTGNTFGSLVSNALGKGTTSSGGVTYGGNTSGSSATGWISSLGTLLGGMFATGGSAQANTPYLVGESGKELFIPKVPGTIVSNPNTERMLGGSNGGSVLNQYFNISTPNAVSFQNSESQIQAQALRGANKFKSNRYS